MFLTLRGNGDINNDIDRYGERVCCRGYGVSILTITTTTATTTTTTSGPMNGIICLLCKL